MLADERVIVHSEYGYILRDFQLRLSAGLQYIGCTRIERREHGGGLGKGCEPFGEIAFRGRCLCGPVLRGACAAKRLAARARPLAVVWVRHEAVGGEASERVEELRGGPFRQDEKKPLLERKGIDNSLLVDRSGRAWMYYVHFDRGNTIWLAELEKDCLHVKPGTERMLFRATEPWEKNSVVEGPFVVKCGRKYALTYSA